MSEKSKPMGLVDSTAQFKATSTKNERLEE
jgi:hypothetical protein